MRAGTFQIVLGEHGETLIELKVSALDKLKLIALFAYAMVARKQYIVIQG